MTRNKGLIGFAAAMAMVGCAGAGIAKGAPKAAALPAALLNDPIRPEADRVRDADRKPVEVLAFAGVKAGTKVAELAPGGGYFTRLLSGVVGPVGRVYAIVTRPSPAIDELAKLRPNVVVTMSQPGQIMVPEPVDLVWTTLNYHDFKNQKVGEGDGAAALNAAAFKALKRGGTYFIVDHAAAAGAGATQTSTLHRIDPATVRQEVEAAGFKLAGQSDLLRHAADDHSAKVQETGIRGKTDQFILRFRKP